MKNFLFLLSILSVQFLYSCSGKSDCGSKDTIDSLNNVIAKQMGEITALTDTINMIRFPADQRFAKAVETFNAGNLDEAASLFNEIKKLFPLSEEAKQCDTQLQKISDKRQELIAEQERIKALGFKALTPVLSSTIDDVSVSFSRISVGKEFIHDTNLEFFKNRCNTADKGNKFITCSMAATSNSSDPNLPTLALYSIKGDKLEKVGVFRIEFARWDGYVTFIGKKPDLHNDFAKVNTVKFTLGCEASEDVFAKPYIVVLKLTNSQKRNYNSSKRPSYWYTGKDEYPNSLNIEDFSSEYKAIKIANL